MESLPQDPDALRDYLEGQCAQLEESARQAAEDRRRQRVQVLREYAERVSKVDAALAGSPEAEKSARLRAAIEAEIIGIESGSHALPAQPPSLEAAAAPAAAPAAAAPLPADSFDHARALFEEAQRLKLAAPTLDLRELECRVNVEAGRARELQDTHPQFRKTDIDPGRSLHRTFGTYSSLAREFFKDAGIWVDGLSPEFETDWHAYVERWRGRLKNVMEQLELERKRKHSAEEEERKQRQLAEANSRVCAQLIDEIEEHIRFAPTDDDPEWAVDLRELVAEALDYGGAGEERLLRALAPFAGLFSEGHAFRGLRRKLKKDPTAVHDESSVRLPAVAASTRAEDPVRARYQGRMGGRRAAIIGGSRREHRRESLQRFFTLDELEWFESEREQAGNHRALADRISNGAYDIVFLLARFCGHSLHDKVKRACKDSGVPFALVESGYGIAGLCRSLQSLGRLADPLVED